MLIICTGRTHTHTHARLSLGLRVRSQTLSHDYLCQHSCGHNNWITGGGYSVLCLICKQHVPRNVGTCGYQTTSSHRASIQRHGNPDFENMAAGWNGRLTVRGVSPSDCFPCPQYIAEVNKAGKAHLMYAFILNAFLAVLRATVALVLIDCRYKTSAAK